jgi:hypothetical protein
VTLVIAERVRGLTVSNVRVNGVMNNERIDRRSSNWFQYPCRSLLPLLLQTVAAVVQRHDSSSLCRIDGGGGSAKKMR